MFDTTESFWNWGASTLPEIETWVDLNLIFSKETVFHASTKLISAVMYAFMKIKYSQRVKYFFTEWKVSKYEYRVFSGSYFPVLRPEKTP